MIKIKWKGDRIAERPDGGPWKSDNKHFEYYLNTVAKPERVKGYVPDMQEAILNLVKEDIPDIEVLEYTPQKIKKAPEDADF